jgi:hypothetical protein
MRSAKSICRPIEGQSPVSYTTHQVGEEKVRQNPGSPLFFGSIQGWSRVVAQQRTTSYVGLCMNQ